MAPCTERHGDDSANERSKADTQARVFHHSRFTPERIADERAGRGLSVSVCLPARECAETVGEIVTVLAELRSAGVIDELVVVDA
ncbi:MAG TPA: hypothetical protein VK538_08705, partial [Solirubrobacteraceae bacterium]|nr:hypothetical protein [Solirubrobacteraceae bacterium]